MDSLVWEWVTDHGDVNPVQRDAVLAHLTKYGRACPCATDHVQTVLGLGVWCPMDIKYDATGLRLCVDCGVRYNRNSPLVTYLESIGEGLVLSPNGEGIFCHEPGEDGEHADNVSLAEIQEQEDWAPLIRIPETDDLWDSTCFCCLNWRLHRALWVRQGYSLDEASTVLALQRSSSSS